MSHRNLTPTGLPPFKEMLLAAAERIEKQAMGGGNSNQVPSAIPEFKNTKTPEQAYATPKPSVPYVQGVPLPKGTVLSGGAKVPEDRLAIDRKATKENIYSNMGPGAQLGVEAQQTAARADAMSASPGMFIGGKGKPNDRPIVINPLGVDAKGTWSKGTGAWGMGYINTNRPSQILTARGRAHYRLDKKVDDIFMANPPDSSTVLKAPFPKPTGYNPAPGKPGHNPEIHKQTVLQEEAVHSLTPNAFPTGPNFNGKDTTAPKVPGTGMYSQKPDEQILARALDQYDSQATYGYRIQNAGDLLKYHNMHKLYGTTAEWEEARKNLTPLHVERLKELREAWKNKSEMPDVIDSAPQQPAPEMKDATPNRELYQFIDATNLMKQVHNGNTPPTQFPGLNKVGSLGRLGLAGLLQSSTSTPALTKLANLHPGLRQLIQAYKRLKQAQMFPYHSGEG